MISRALLGGGTLLVAALLAALAVQSLRLAGARTDLAVLAGELAQANTRISLLEESEKTLLAARDGLAGQVEACQRAGLRSEVRARDRGDIARNAKPVPAEAGKVVDDATSRRAARHLNDALGH